MTHNPWTGERRDQRDIETDPHGRLLVPRDLPLIAAKRHEFSLEGVFHAKLALTGKFSKKLQGYAMGAFREAVDAFNNQEKPNGQAVHRHDEAQNP